MISRSSACCSLLCISALLIPPGLMLEILVKLGGFHSIGPPMLPAVWKLVSEETLVTVIIVGHKILGRPDVLGMVRNLVASHSSHNLLTLHLGKSLLTLSLG